MKKRFALIIMLITCIGIAGCSAKQPKSDEVTDSMETIAESNVKISEDIPAESKSDTDVQKSAESEAPEKSPKSDEVTDSMETIAESNVKISEDIPAESKSDTDVQKSAESEAPEKSKEQSQPEEKTYKAENEPSNPASQTDEKVDESVIEPSEYPSPSEEPLTTNVMKVSSEIAKELGNGFSYIEDVINEDFSGLTQEQFDRIAIYKSTHEGRHPYNEAVAAGLVDADAPKMTLEKMEEIISEANDSITSEHRFNYILDEAKKIQPYYDITTNNTYDYYYVLSTDEDGKEKEVIKITIGYPQGVIQYIRTDEKGENGKNKKEILYEA